MRIKYFIAFFFLLFSIANIFAQKAVLNYPFKFEKKSLKEPDNDANFLVDKGLDEIAFVLHDIKKAEYVRADKRMKVISKFTVPVDKTVFNMSHPANKEEFLGGSGIPSSGIFHYLYKSTTFEYRLISNKSKVEYRTETVDFNSSTVSQKEFTKIPDHEKLVVNFTDYGECFLLMADNKTSDLVVYKLAKDGQTVIKKIPFNIPAGKGKNRNSLSEYLNETHLVKDEEEAELETATRSTKLFATADKFIFVINDNASPTHVVNIDKKTFTLTEKFIDHSSLFTGAEKEKVYVNSFFADSKLFSLILNKKNIQMAVYDLQNDKLMKQQDITEENYEKTVAITAVTKKRKGSKEEEEDVDDFKKLLKALTKGTEGLLVTKNAAGQYIVTIGTYDRIAVQTGGGGSYHTSIGTVNTGDGTPNGPPNPTGTARTYTNTTYTPGISSYTKENANYYKITSFKLLLDPTTLNTIKGKIKPTVGDQIKDYMDDKSKKIRKQFAIGELQYFGYYDKDLELYIIENIPIKR